MCARARMCVEDEGVELLSLVTLGHFCASCESPSAQSLFLLVVAACCVYLYCRQLFAMYLCVCVCVYVI